MRNMFDGPTPGQSLTHAPGAMKWEQPPQFVKVDDAMDYITKRFLRPDKAAEFIAIVDSGLPIEGVVRPLLFGGFMEGKWNFDLMVLLAKPVTAFLSFLYKHATGKTPELFFPQKKDKLAKLMSLKKGDAEELPDASKKVMQAGGLMGRTNV